MSSFIFNVALGRVAGYAALEAASDSLVLVPIESSGVETDAVIRDKDTLADVLSGATNEQTTLGRKTLTGTVITVSDADDQVTIASDNAVYAATAGNAISDILICYKPASGSADSAIIPLAWFDFPVTPDGTDLTVGLDTTWYEAVNG